MSRRAPSRIGRALVGVAVAVSVALTWVSIADLSRDSTSVTEASAATSPATAPSTTEGPARVKVVERPEPTTTTVKPKPARKKVVKKAARKKSAEPTLAELRKEFHVAPFEGVGAWVDVFDWTESRGGGRSMQRADVDAMAKLGVRTIYIQTSINSSDKDIMERRKLERFIKRAHMHGMKVVSWYLPTLDDVNKDLRRLVAPLRLGVDGIGVDIEWTGIRDVNVRNTRIVQLSRQLRQRAGKNTPLAAVTLDAVHLQVVNPAFWPKFPWRQIGKTYDAVMPMAYWSIRNPQWNDAERYTTENIRRIREATGRKHMPVHVIGGIANEVNAAEVAGMARAAKRGDAIGGGLYDWRTSQASEWRALKPLRKAKLKPVS